MAQTVDLSEIRFVQRILVGSDDPLNSGAPQDADRAMALLNRCLNDAPRGRIIALEKGSAVFNLAGDNQAVFQWVVYHVGFPRKPVWLDRDDGAGPWTA